jgi:hypothetical protein
MMQPLHHKELAINCVVGLVEAHRRSRHFCVFEQRIPASFLVVEPLPHPGTMGGTRLGRDCVRKAAQLLPERKHPQALALATPEQQRGELVAECLPDCRGDSREFPGQLLGGME